MKKRCHKPKNKRQVCLGYLVKERHCLHFFRSKKPKQLSEGKHQVMFNDKMVDTQTLCGLIAARQRTASGPGQLPRNNTTNGKKKRSVLTIKKSCNNPDILVASHQKTAWSKPSAACPSRVGSRDERNGVRRLMLVSLPDDPRPISFGKEGTSAPLWYDFLKREMCLEGNLHLGYKAYSKQCPRMAAVSRTSRLQGRNPYGFPVIQSAFHHSSFT